MADEEAYSVRVSPAMAGIALRVASTNDAELAKYVRSMAIYKGEDSFRAFSDKVSYLVFASVDLLFGLLSKQCVCTRQPTQPLYSGTFDLACSNLCRFLDAE